MGSLLWMTLVLQAALLTDATTGAMTMWSLHSDVIVGSNIAHEGGPSACKFADPSQGGLKSPAAGSPYIKSRHYCAADINTLFQKGAACGKCYKVSFSGSGGTNGGHAGSTVIQVINSGHMNHNAVFDCQVDAFKAITGAETGVYPITYEEVTCDQAEGGGVATVITGNNAWYTKVVFSNLPRPATSVEMVAQGKTHKLEMEPCCGTWKGQLGGEKGPVGFDLTHSDGSKTSFQGCFETWPTRSGAFCKEGGSATSGSTTGSTAASSNSVQSGHVQSPATCSGSWNHDCRKTRWCAESGYKCYTKSKFWAACKPSCKKGEVDKWSKHGWDCDELTQDYDASAQVMQATSLVAPLALCAGFLSLASGLVVAWRRRPQRASILTAAE